MELIENTSGRLKTIEILANFFRSVIVLTPDDLLHCVYLCLNKVAPSFEGNYSISCVPHAVIALLIATHL